MKKTLIGFLTILLTLSSIGCSSTENEVKPQDSNFIKSLEKATKDRWDYVEDVETGKINVESDLEYVKECVKKESTELYKYIDVEFTDVKLKKLANEYINGIKTQEEALKYFNADEMKYDTLWSEGYDVRSVALLELVEDYGVKVDGKQFEELKNNSQVVKENKETEKAIDEMVKTINFEHVNSEYGLDSYSATVENSTNLKFDDFSLEVNLLDEDGVVIDNQYVNAINWKPGQKVKFEFSTDKKFNSIEWEYTYYME